MALVTVLVVPLALWIAHSQVRTPTKVEVERKVQFRKSLAAYSAINQAQHPEVNRVATVEDKEKLINLSFKALTTWTYVAGKTPIPDYIKGLDGQHVQMAGFMMPLNQTDQVTEFVFMQYFWGCCFGRPPAANHVVLVKMTNGQKSKFYTEPVCVRGILHVGETREDGYLISLYRLDAETVAECQ